MFAPFAIFTALISAANAGSGEMYERAVALIRHRYLGLESFDARAAFAEAAEAAEDVVPWLLVETTDGVVTLSHGQTGVITVVTLGDGPASSVTGQLDALPDALVALEEAIVGVGSPVPEEVDLPVALLRGVSREMDRHSVVLSRGRLARFDERIKGKLTGIGARMGSVDGHLVVKEVFPRGPAATGGLRSGDRIVRVDGVSVLGMSSSIAIDRIRGPADTQVLVDVERPQGDGTLVTLELVLTRAEVVIPTVHAERLPSGVGVVRIDTFSEQTTRMLRDALADFRGQQEPVRGIVVDLRGNTGGSLLQACKVADLFLNDGTVLRTEGREGRSVDNLLRVYRAHPEGIEVDVPVAILMDARSASASEIVAGALSRLGRAVLIGDRSHGKGTVQKLYTLRGGSREERVRLKLTVARYLLPDGVPIETGVGLVPDLVVAPVTFSRRGVQLSTRDDASQELIWVDEQPGWREGVPLPPERDVALAVANETLLNAAGSTRLDVLSALEAAGARAAVDEDALLREVFGHRGLDWSASPELGPPPQVSATLTVIDPPIPGSDVEVRVAVTNHGSESLRRVWVDLSTDSRLPWSGVTLPVGQIAGGESALGSAMVSIDGDLTAREDEVSLRLFADERVSVQLAPALLEIAPALPNAVAAEARLVTGAADGDRIALELENQGGRHLERLRVQVRLPEDAPVELLTPEADLALLPAGGRIAVPFSVRRLSPGRIEFELRVVDGDGLRVFRQRMALQDDGSLTRVVPPRVSLDLPLSAQVGQAQLNVDARDDSAMASVTVWLAGDKVAWIPGGGPAISATVPLDVPAGTSPVTVEAVDEHGARTVEVGWIRGVDSGTAENADEP